MTEKIQSPGLALGNLQMMGEVCGLLGGNAPVGVAVLLRALRRNCLEVGRGNGGWKVKWMGWKRGVERWL